MFPDEKAGMAALVALLGVSSYQTRSMDDAIARYAPSGENPTAHYQQFIRSETGLGGSKFLNTFTRAEIQSLAEAIKKFESWQPGIISQQA